MMNTAIKQLKAFSLNWAVPVVDVMLFYMAVFTAVVNLPLWSIVEPWTNITHHRLLSLFFLSSVVVQINYGWMIVNIPRLVRGISTVLLLMKNRTVRRRGFWFASTPILGIVIISWLSRYWSVAPKFSEERFLYFSTVVAAGLYIGLEFKLSRNRLLFEILSALIAIGTLYAVIRQPDFAIMKEPHAGSWRGIFWWKSYLGEMAGLAAVIFLFRWAEYKKANGLSHYSRLFFTCFRLQY